MKLCKDCKWVKRDPVFGIFGSYVYAQCTAPQAQKEDGRPLVDGKLNDTVGCAAHRGLKGFGVYCGSEGRFWEAKEEATDQLREARTATT